MIAAAIALNVLGALWPFHPRAETVARQYVLPIWGFTTVKDRFTGRMSCQVFQGSKAHPIVSYASHTVAFHFARNLDVSDAWYKLDGAPARQWRMDFPRLTSLGVGLDGDSMENPTGGLVVLPIEEVKGVHTITIRPAARSAPRQFGLDGLNDAVASAQSQGCDPDNAFHH